MRRYCISVLLAAVFVFACFVPSSSGAEPRGDITLDGDRVIFDQASGMAEAEGTVRLRQDNVRIFSHRMEYDTVNQFAVATSRPGEVVTLLYGGNRFTGKTLEYDMEAGEGMLTDATGDLPAGTRGGTVYIRGKNLEVVPLNSALESKWISSRQTRRVKGEDRLVARGTAASMTTSPAEDPLPLLTNGCVIPGVRHSEEPRSTSQNSLSYPFDYEGPLHGEKDYLLGIFTPSMVYESDKGVGYALTGP